MKVLERFHWRGSHYWALPLFLMLLAAPRASRAADEPVSVLEGTPAGALAFSPDGKSLAIGAEYKGPLKIWTVGDSQPPRVIEDVKAMYQSVAFSPDGKLLTASRISLDPAESVVSVWDAGGKKRFMEYKFGAFWSAFSPDSKTIVLGKYKVVELLDARSGRRVSGFQAQNDADVSAGDFAANGKLFVTAGGEEKQLKFWNPKTGTLLRTISTDGPVPTLAISPNGRQVAYAVANTLYVADADKGTPLWSSKSHTDTIMNVRFAPSGNELASASHDRTVRRWKADDGTEISIYEPDRGVVQSCAYAPDGNTLAVGTSGVVLIYSLRPGETRRSVDPRGKQDDLPAEKLAFKLRDVNWKTGEARAAVLRPRQGLAFLSGLAGNFAGKGDSFELQIDKSGSWSLGGTSTDFLAVRTATVTDLRPLQFSPELARYEWMHDRPAVKMLHRDEGICVLTGFGGVLRGFGDEVQVRLADDGYWYLEGKSGQGDLRATAVGLKWAKSKRWTCRADVHSWKTGQERVNVGSQSAGLCVLSGISGNMQGGGEGVEIIQEDGSWFLRGTSQQPELRFDATLIRFIRVGDRP